MFTTKKMNTSSPGILRFRPKHLRPPPTLVFHAILPLVISIMNSPLDIPHCLILYQLDVKSR